MHHITHPVTAAPLSWSLLGLAQLWDRRAAEAAESATAEAYHRAAAEAQEVIRALAAGCAAPCPQAPDDQHDLGI